MRLVKARWASLAVTALVAASSGSAAPAPQADQVSMATYSWGRLLSGWTLRPDGSGTFKSSHAASNDFNDRAVVAKGLPAAPGRYDQVLVLLHAAEPYADKTLPCTLQATDGPYGEIVWRRQGVTHRLNVQYGCQSKQADAVYDQLGAAQALVAKWAANAPVTNDPDPGNP
jgi:hypothetical protein